jgi:hypothetical protein
VGQVVDVNESRSELAQSAAKLKEYRALVEGAQEEVVCAGADQLSPKINVFGDRITVTGGRDRRLRRRAEILLNFRNRAIAVI